MKRSDIVPWLRLLVGGLALVILAAAIISAATAPPTDRWLPGEELGMHQLGYVFATERVPVDSDGRPHLFRVADRTKASRRYLTNEMRAQLSRAVREVRPVYRPALAFYFADYKGRQFFAVVVDGHPEIPVLNLCAPDPARDCQRYCPYFSDPLLRRVVASTMPVCADRAAYLEP